jgi:hypothetical protein
MVTSVIQTQSVLNFLLNQIFISYCRSQIFELYHIFKESISWFCPAFWWWDGNFYLNFFVVTYGLTSLLASVKVSVLFFMLSMLSSNRYTSAVQTSSWCVPFNFSPIRFSWTFLMAYSIAKFKCNSNKIFPCYIPFWIGNISDTCLSIWTVITFYLNTF